MLTEEDTAAQNIIKAPKLQQNVVAPGNVDESYISCSDLDEGGQTAEKGDSSSRNYVPVDSYHQMPQQQQSRPLQQHQFSTMRDSIASPPYQPAAPSHDYGDPVRPSELRLSSIQAVDLRMSKLNSDPQIGSNDEDFIAMCE